MVLLAILPPKWWPWHQPFHHHWRKLCWPGSPVSEALSLSPMTNSFVLQEKMNKSKAERRITCAAVFGFHDLSLPPLQNKSVTVWSVQQMGQWKHSLPWTFCMKLGMILHLLHMNLHFEVNSPTCALTKPTALSKLLSKLSEYQCQNHNCVSIISCQNAGNWEFYRSWNCHACTKPRAVLQWFSRMYSLFTG